MSRPSLNFPEWFVVIAFLALMASLVIISKVSSSRAKVVLETVKPIQKISIEVSGEVDKPGTYKVEVGSTMGELLRKARPKRFADLSGLSLDAPLEMALSVLIPPLQEIRVRVLAEGLEGIELRVLPGTRVSDLKSKLALGGEFDLTPFKSRRLVKPGEEIGVKKKILLP